MNDELLHRLLSDGTPEPLDDMADGTHAILNTSHGVTVYGAHTHPAFNLTAQISWPKYHRRTKNVWSVLAPTATQSGFVLINMATTDISRLPDNVQWCLLTQHARHGSCALPRSRPHSATLTADALVLTGFPAPVRVGPAYTATREAYEQHANEAFHFLSPALQNVARAIAEHGPITRKDLAAQLYGKPNKDNEAALDMALHRLRKAPRISLTRAADGPLAIAVTEQESAGRHRS